MKFWLHDSPRHLDSPLFQNTAFQLEQFLDAFLLTGIRDRPSVLLKNYERRCRFLLPSLNEVVMSHTIEL